MVDRRRPERIPEFDPYNPGKTVNGDVRTSMPLYESAFGTLVTNSTANRLDIPGTYEYNISRHRFVEDGTFIRDIADTTALTDSPGKFQVTAAAGEEHTFGARERVRYVPNYELLWGLAFWAEETLQSGQHFAVEFSTDTFDNGYRYRYDGGAEFSITLEQASGGSIVDSVTVDTDRITDLSYGETVPAVARNFLNWYGAGISRYDLSFPRVIDGESIDQMNEELGRTSLTTDVATEEINLRPQIRVWADAGADPVTVNACSIGALVRGQASEYDREKPAVFWDIGGTISQYPTDNTAAVFAARIDPTRANTVVKMLPPKFRPAGSAVNMDLTVGAVHKDHPDLTVNFDDPDDDGVDEGPAPAAQAREQTDVMQYTRDVTAFPTTTDIRADGTEGLVPDVRHLTSTLADSGGGTTGGQISSAESETVKRIIHDDDVVLFIPRTDPAGSTTNGTIRWLKIVSEQDW